MDYDRFITIVDRATGVSREAAERAMRATLQTLADRISKEEGLQNPGMRRQVDHRILSV
jgi:uncharacterized protein (DUF2267 family)